MTVLGRMPGIPLNVNLHSSVYTFEITIPKILHLYSVRIWKLNNYLEYFPDVLFYYFIFRWFLLRSGSQGNAMMTLIICLFHHRFSRWSQGSRDCSPNTTSRKKPWQWRSSGSWPTVASEWIQFAVFISFKDKGDHGKKPSRQRSLWWKAGVFCTIFCSSFNCFCFLFFRW